MLVRDILRVQKTAVSFEFFPPKEDSGWDRLFQTIARLIPLEPSYVSVTYGAGGSTRERTHELVERIHKETGLTVVAHLSCVGSQEKEVGEILERYANIGVENILAIRGDPPRDGSMRGKASDFRNAADLVRFIKRSFPHMGVGVAGFPEGHPETPNRLVEMDYLKAKVDAGADYIVTQLFFLNVDFLDFCERCRINGIGIPIIAGIMPITSLRGMRRMSELAGGARIPAQLMGSILRADGPTYVRNVGIHWATEQVRDLIHKEVAGVHFYTLNHSNASLEICESLGLRSFSKVAGIRLGRGARQ